jgi:TetR/AcrR family transcriptional repressor of bet genes
MASRKASPPRRVRPRAERERQLLAAARRCISGLGIHGTTVQQVARAAGMAVGSISLYFRGKDALLTAVLRELAAEFEAHRRAALAAAPDDPLDRLHAFVHCYFAPQLCQRDKVAVWFAFWGEVQARPRYQEVCAAFDRRHDAELLRLCAAVLQRPGRGARQSRRGAMPAAAVARAIAALCQGLWLEFLTAADRPGRERLAALACQGVEALLAGSAPLSR